MPKFFQNKFLLKLVQVFLVCLIVLGGGILRNGEYVQAAVCPINTGNCDGSVDGSCETDLLTDANNCGHCGIVCNGICENGECKEFLGGLIPCGRISDDCDTAWDERADCNLCHLIIMGKLIIDFLLETAVVVGALFVTLGGILYIFAAGDKGKMALAKRTISLTLYGFAIVFVSWIIVDTVMIVFGYIDPLDSGGKWHKMNCEVPMRTCDNFCGNGIVDPGEECERTESLADFQARTGGTAAEWVEMKGSCSFGCDFRCIDPSTGEPDDRIGEGCYNPLGGTGSRCQKGKYTCLVDSDTVECVDIFSDPNYSWDPQYVGKKVYDYCCSFMEGEITKTEARTAIQDLGVTRIKHPEAWTDSGANPAFHCEDVCKSAGKICVGVGLTDDVMADGCHGVTCHSGSDCTGNTGNLDCRLPFPFVRAGDHNECTKCNGDNCTYKGVDSPYYVGYSSCLCF